jgi:hypothetical protein
MGLMTPREIVLAVARAEDKFLRHGPQRRWDLYKLYVVATSLPDSIITKKVLAKRCQLGLQLATWLSMIFDIKFDLTRKARLVLNGAKHKVPKVRIILSVVSRDSVRISFTPAA